MVDKKVCDWVDKIVNREYQKKRNFYDKFGPGNNGVVVAEMVVNKRLYDWFGKAAKRTKKAGPKERFLMDAIDYSDRIGNFYHADSSNRSILREAYYKNKMWKGE